MEEITFEQIKSDLRKTMIKTSKTEQFNEDSHFAKPIEPGITGSILIFCFNI